MLKTFYPKIKKKMSLDHYLLVELMPQNYPTDKQEDGIQSTGTSAKTHDPCKKLEENKVSGFILTVCHC